MGSQSDVSLKVALGAGGGGELSVLQTQKKIKIAMVLYTQLHGIFEQEDFVISKLLIKVCKKSIGHGFLSLLKFSKYLN